MRKRGFAVLFILTLVIVAGTIVQDFRFDTLLEGERTSTVARDRQLGSTEVAMADLRTAEAAYVAMGQGPAVWIDRATTLFTEVESGLTTLRTTTPSADATAHYDAALAAVKDLEGIDAHARTEVQGDRRLEASDRVFTDSREANDRVAAELTAARRSEEETAAGRIERLGRLRLAMNGVALLFVLAVAAFFWRAQRSAPAPAVVESRAADQTSGLLHLGTPARSSPSVLASSLPGAAASASAPVAASAAVAAPASSKPPGPASVRDVNLRDAAELCVDLGRVIDGRDVQALLARAAGVLDAKGVILWMTDAGGALLRPTLAHGYSDRVLGKMGSLQVDGDNATSLAFRSLRGQTISGAASSTAGAIAVPLITPSGCVGVLAAEVNRQRPSAETLDIARIIAAQLAVLVVPSAEGSRAAQG